MNAGSGRVAGMLALLAVGTLLSLGACAGPAKQQPPVPVEPVPPNPDGPREGALPAAEAILADSTLIEPRAIPGAARGTAGARRVVPPAAAETAPADSLPPPTISVRLSDEERVRLQQDAEHDIHIARESLARLELRGPNEAIRESIVTLRDLVDSAEATVEKGDLPAAAQLARKARLLAEELLTR